MGYASDVAQAAVDGTFAEFGAPASYTPSWGGDPVPCTVIFDVRDGSARPEDGSPPAGQATIEVRASEVAQPAVNSTFTMEARSRVYTVTSRPLPQDPEGLVWTMWVE